MPPRYEFFSSGGVEPVYEIKDGSLGPALCWPGLPPEQLGLQRFGESLGSGIIVAIALAADR
jgi:hypothetical protein